MTVTGLARQSIDHYFKTGKMLTTPPDLPAELQTRAGAFVSLKEPNGDLRGCIGTISPTTGSLGAEIIANAVSAATHDPRFEPVTLAELTQLQLSVDVLNPPVPETDLTKLDPKIYGIIVSAADGRQGVLLPDLEGVTIPAEQISICRQKANIGPDELVKISKFQVKRFEQPT